MSFGVSLSLANNNYAQVRRQQVFPLQEIPSQTQPEAETKGRDQTRES